MKTLHAFFVPGTLQKHIGTKQVLWRYGKEPDYWTLVDPDGLEVSTQYYVPISFEVLISNNLSLLPGFGHVDIISYMLSSDECSCLSVRDFIKSEGYT